MNNNTEPQLHDYAVSVIYVRNSKDGDTEQMEVRNQMVRVEAESEEAACWLAQRLFEEDSQIQSDYKFAQSLAMKLEAK